MVVSLVNKSRLFAKTTTQLPLMLHRADFSINFLKSKPVVSIINLSGSIQAEQGRPGKFGNSSKLNLLGLEKSIDKAFSYKNLKSVLLNVNSPGGSPVQSELIANKIVRLGKKNNVKVYSFVEDLAASGGYFLACAGDEIYATKHSIVGSIGVISFRMGFNELIKNYGIDWRVHTAGKSKSFLDPFQAEKDEDVVKLKRVLNIIHGNFIDYVKSRRGGRLNASDDTLFNGDIWAGEEAVENGLIDGIDDIGNFIETRYGVKGKDIRVVHVNAGRGLSQIFGRLGTSSITSGLEESVYSERFKVM